MERSEEAGFATNTLQFRFQTRLGGKVYESIRFIPMEQVVLATYSSIVEELERDHFRGVIRDRLADIEIEAPTDERPALNGWSNHA
jgi:hypothetical protein